MNLGRTRGLARRTQCLDAQGLCAMFGAVVRTPEGWDACRHRLHDRACTFWMFLEQTLCGDKSCTQAVAKNAVRRACGGQAPVSPGTGAYCKARRRLSKNQAVYPQPSGQAPGCGCPVMRLLAVFSLATGAMVAFARASLKVSERPLFRVLWKMLDPADVVLADRGFCGHAEGWLLMRRGVDWVMRNHARRTVGVTPVRRIGKNDRIVQWHKTKVRPKWMELEPWRAMPDTMDVREITVHVDILGFRTSTVVIVTSLLDEVQFTAEDFARLYRARWMCELFLRDIKTTLGMDILRCKTPE